MLYPSTEKASVLSPEEIYTNIKKMDGPDSQFLTSELIKKGRLYTEPEEHINTWGYDKVITFGNSGLLLVEQDGVLYRHFIPDGAQNARSGDGRRFAHAYIAGLASMIHWYKERYNENDLSCFGVTNHRFSNFMQRLLGTDIYKVLKIHRDNLGEEIVSELDLSILSRNEALCQSIDVKAREIHRLKYHMDNWLG